MLQIFEYNGSALIAMVGKNCFAIASDRRLGVQLQTVATDFQKIYKIHDKLWIGICGLATDAQTLYGPPSVALSPSLPFLAFFLFIFLSSENFNYLIIDWVDFGFVWAKVSEAGV